LCYEGTGGVNFYKPKEKEAKMSTRKMKRAILLGLALFVIIAAGEVSWGTISYDPETDTYYVENSPDLYILQFTDTYNPPLHNGATIVLTPGTYGIFYEQAPIDPPAVGSITYRSMKSIDPGYIQGYDYAGNTILSGVAWRGPEGWGYAACVNLQGGDSAELISLTIKCGFDQCRGFCTPNAEASIVCKNANLTINNCLVVGGTASCYDCNDVNGIYCENSNVEIKGCTISISNLSTHSDIATQAAIVIMGSGNIEINNCAIIGNNGPSIWCWSSTANIIVTNCTFDGKDKEGILRCQGLCFNNDVNATITGSTIRNCVRYVGPIHCAGAGIYIDGSLADVKIDGCTLMDNNSNTYSGSPIGIGGAICVAECNSADINNCIISRNKAESGGGIDIRDWAKNVTIRNCIISDNNAVEGGGISNSGGGTTVTHCKITGNKAVGGGSGCGGGINSGADINIINCQITGNKADTIYNGQGGGMFMSAGNAKIINCTIAHNIAYLYGGAAFYGDAFLNNNIFQGNSPDQQIKGLWSEWNDMGVQIGNCYIQHSKSAYDKYEEAQCIVDLDFDPEYPNEELVLGKDLGKNIVPPAYADPNPKLTPDYHLDVCSPCINAGDNDAAAGIDFDIDGEPRIIDSNVDIGADEASYPVSWWKFDEGSGSIAYDSVGSNHGTITGATWTNGQINGAINFDGVNDYINVGNDSSLKQPLPVTISAWIKLNALGIPQEILCIDNQSTRYYGIWFYVNSYNALTIGYGNGGYPGPRSRRGKDGKTALTSDQWYHVAAVLGSKTDIRLYINGVEDVGGTYSGSAASVAYSTGTSLIGNDNSFTNRFNGVMDDVRVYKKALTGDEIWQLYQKGFGGKAFAPNPADGATRVSPDTVLSWSPGYLAISHDVYFGSENPPPLVSSNQPDTTYDPTETLSNGVTYYWRIDEKTAAGTTTTGDVWSFKTLVEPNLVSLWRFDEGGGTIAYDSAGSNNGNITSATWFNDPCRGMCLSFDGTNDYVDVGNDSSLKPPLPVTISAWINLNASRIPQEILCIDNQSTRYYGIWFYVNSNNTLTIGYGNGGYPGPSSRRGKDGTTAALVLGRWYHVAAVVRSRTDIKLYINAVEDAGKYSGSAVSVAYSTGGTSLIGCSNSFTNRFNGVMDDVRVYNKALSAGEVEQLYQDGL
jgi:hypothetical protein